MHSEMLQPQMNARKVRAKPTCNQPRCETDDRCMEIFGLFYNQKKGEGTSGICHAVRVIWGLCAAQPMATRAPRCFEVGKGVDIMRRNDEW